MAALVIDWGKIAGVHVEAKTADETGTGMCIQCGHGFPCRPARMAAMTLQDMEERRQETTEGTDAWGG